MLKNHVMTAVLGAALLLSSGSVVFAADAAAPAAKEKAAVSAKLTKEQIKDIQMACKKDSKKDKAAYKACVKEKKEAAKAEKK